MASNVQDHGFQRKGQAWFCTTGLPSDIIVEVGEMSFHLHKFPLMSRSGKLEKLVAEAENHEDGFSLISLPDVPGGAEAFEMAAKFCYGVRVDLTAANVVSLRCTAEFLEMTEDFGDGNLIVKCEDFLNHVVLRSWKDSVTALQSSEKLLPAAEELNVVKRCVDSIVTKACKNPSFFGWPVTGDGTGMQSPGGSVLWNGINTGLIPRNSRTDWWYEDLSRLSLPLYKRVISAMVAKGLESENIAGSLTHYAKKWLPGLNRRRRAALPVVSVAMSEREQKELLETIESLLPEKKAVTSTGFLFGLLRTAMILNAGAECMSRLERRIGGQLEEAVIEHLLIPNYSYKSETLYDVGCIRRIVDHFVGSETAAAAAPHFLEGTSPLMASPSITPIMLVSKLIDGYLSEIAADVNLKPLDFQALAGALPDYARVSDDGLYRAIDIYVKAHSWLTEEEREEISGVMDCEKLSVEARTHAAQNERMPLRVIVQVLFHEQLQLRTAIAGCILAGEASGESTGTPYGLLTQVTGSTGERGMMRENEALKLGMASMQCKVQELEGECSSMRQEMEKLKGGRKGGALSKKLWCTLMPQICESHEAPEARGLRRRRKGRSLSLDASHL